MKEEEEDGDCNNDHKDLITIMIHKMMIMMVVTEVVINVLMKTIS